MTLDDKGRCCGRKPLVYRRPPHLFCDRCCRAFNAHGRQIENWAWTAAPDAEAQADGFDRYVPVHPKASYAKRAFGVEPDGR